MTVLLDTHALIWWLVDDPRLSGAARAALADEDTVVWVSAASIWEVCTKVRLGKLPHGERLATDLVGHVRDQGFTLLDITASDAQRAGLHPSPHRDPFDRMLAAQAIARDVPVVTSDPALAAMGARTLW